MRVFKKYLHKQKQRTVKKQLFKSRIRAIRRQGVALTISFILVITATIIVPPQKAEAAIVYRSSSTFNGSAGPTMTITAPASIDIGDVLVATFGTDNNSDCNATLAGWTTISYTDASGTPNKCLKTLYHVVSGTPPANYVFTVPGSGLRVAGIQAFSGVDTTNVIDNGGASKSANFGNSTTATATGFTTLRNNTMLVFSSAHNDSVASTVSGMTERYDIEALSTGISADDGLQAVAGATGNKTSTVTSDDWAAHMVALNPLRPALDQSSFRFLSNIDSNGSEFIVSNPSATDDTIRGLATDSANGFFYIGGYTTTEWRVQKRNINDGSLVAAFAYPTGVTGNVGGIAIDPTGNYIYVAGNSGGTWRIEKRRTSDAALCTAANCGTAFDTDGIINSGAGFPGAGSLNSIDIDGVNGFIYVGGYETATNDKWLIGKYNSLTGAVGSSFNQAAGTGCSATAGYACNNPGTGSDRIRTISVDPQNGYVYAGGWYVNANTDWRMEKRRTSDGALCSAANCGTQFATNGVYTETPTAGTDQILTFQVDTPGNAIYVGGFDSTSGNQWRLEKLNATTGALCTAANCGVAFDTDGIVTYNLTTGDDQLLDLDLDDAGGYIYTTGQEDNSGTNIRWRIEKRNRSDGALVSSFGTSGAVIIDPSANDDAPAWIAVDLLRNYLYTSGGDRSLGVSNQQWRIQKFDLDYGGTWLSTPQDTAAIASTNITFRLRLLLHVSVAQLGIGEESLKLQYAPKVGTCDTAFVNENYQDVTTSSNEIRYHDNSSLADGVTLAAGLTGDPVHSGHSTVRQTIEEANAFTTVAAVPIGQDGMWDFTMRDFNAFGAYCFRATYNDATPILLNDATVNGSYSVVPEINFCRNTPTTDALLRSGAYFCSGTKRSFFWARD